MTLLEAALLALAQRHPRVFGRIADAYRTRQPVDEKTGLEFQRIPEVNALIMSYSGDEVMVALASICKEMIEHEGDRV